MSSSNQFFIILPSNTIGYANQPNRYRVHLPRTLNFSGSWIVGLHSISYTYSWNNIGTLDAQWIQIRLVNGQTVRVPIPDSSFSSVENLEDILERNILMELEDKYFKLRDEGNSNKRRKRYATSAIQQSQLSQLKPIEPMKSQNVLREPPKYDGGQKIGENGTTSSQNENPTLADPLNENPTLADTPTIAHPTPLTNIEQILVKIRGRPFHKGEEFIRENAHFPSNISNDEISAFVRGVKFIFSEELNKFIVEIDHPHIESISLSPQIGYILGFEDGEMLVNKSTAKYSVDIKGGINTFGVYTKNLTENIICGNELVSILRVVNITGQHKFGDNIEQIYTSPIFLKVLPKHISEIEIELRSMGPGARLMPFQFGTTTAVLVFKKIINF
jgi:hypothetical protein